MTDGSERQRVLLLVPGSTYRAPDFMQAAERLGVDVVVGSEQPLPLAGVAPGGSLVLPLSRPDDAAHRIASFAAEQRLDAIVAVDDGGTLVAAEASELLGLPHNPLSAVAATRNKSLFRERLIDSGIPSPDFRVVSVDDEARAVAAEIEFPCVLKPLSLSGSRGVIRADDPVQFVSAFERVRLLLADPEIAAECGDDATKIIVEGYIPGIEVAVEGMLDGGQLQVLAIFDKPDPLVGPFFEETIYLTPSRLSEAEQRSLVAQTQRTARALGLRDGPLHAELRLNEEGVWPVDVAARSIGGLCSRVLTFGTGLSLEELILAHAIGASLARAERERVAAGVMMIPIPHAGTLRAVAGLERARGVPGIDEVTITMRTGQRVVPLPEGSEYLGFIFARGAQPADAEAALRTAHGLLAFDIEPDASGAQRAAAIEAAAVRVAQ